MRHYRLSRFLLVVFLVTLPGLASGQPAPTAGGPALVYVPLPTAAALVRFEETGLPAYARLYGAEGAYLLAGADPPGLRRLSESGLSPRLLDPDTAGATYYLVYPRPGQPRPNLALYGRVLLDDGHAVIMRAIPQQAASLARSGIALRLLTLDPKPLRPRPVAALPRVSAPDPLVQTLLDQVQSSTLYQYVGDLSGEWAVQIGGNPYIIRTRHTYSGEPIQKALQFAGQHLADLGLTVEYHQWGGSTYPNIIGERRGAINPTDIYIICAHLDDMPGGTVAPGADDNASGAAAVLVAADILAPYQWGCTLRFALWTGEEQGLKGSAAYAKRCYQRGENIRGVLNLDMIAWDSIGGPDLDLHADQAGVPASLQLAQLVVEVVTAYDLPLVPHVIPNGIRASDQASFWDYGYPALLGIEYYSGGDFNFYYHTTGDRLMYLNLPYLTAWTKAAVGTFVHLTDCLITTTCGPLTQVTLAGPNPDPPWTGEPVPFRADLGPDQATKPYTYTIYADGEAVGVAQVSNDDPLTFSYTFSSTGTHIIGFEAWNCDPHSPISDTIMVEVVAPFYLYLPLLWR